MPSVRPWWHITKDCWPQVAKSWTLTHRAMAAARRQESQMCRAPRRLKI